MPDPTQHRGKPAEPLKMTAVSNPGGWTPCEQEVWISLVLAGGRANRSSILSDVARSTAGVTRGINALLRRQAIRRIDPSEDEFELTEPWLGTVRRIEERIAKLTPAASAAQTDSPLHGTQGKDQR